MGTSLLALVLELVFVLAALPIVQIALLLLPEIPPEDPRRSKWERNERYYNKRRRMKDERNSTKKKTKRKEKATERKKGEIRKRKEVGK